MAPSTWIRASGVRRKLVPALIVAVTVAMTLAVAGVASGSSAWVLVAVSIFSAAVGSLAYRAWHCGLLIDERSVINRGIFRTTAFPLDEVDGFVPGRMLRGGRAAVRLELRGGRSVRVFALTLFAFVWWGPSRWQPTCDELNELLCSLRQQGEW